MRNPTAPITRNPTPTACEILINSRRSARNDQTLAEGLRVVVACRPLSLNGIGLRKAGNWGFVRFVQRLMNCLPSVTNSLGMSKSISWIWSAIAAAVEDMEDRSSRVWTRGWCCREGICANRGKLSEEGIRSLRKSVG